MNEDQIQIKRARAILESRGYTVKKLHEANYDVGYSSNEGELVLSLGGIAMARTLKNKFGGTVSTQTLPTGKKNYLWSTTNEEDFSRAKEYMENDNPRMKESKNIHGRSR